MGCRFKSRHGIFQFFFLSSSFYLLAFYCLFSLLTLLASRDFCENVFLVYYLGALRLSKKSFVGFHMARFHRARFHMAISYGAVGRFAAKKGSLRSPRGRLVATLGRAQVKFSGSGKLHRDFVIWLASKVGNLYRQRRKH